MIDSTRSPLPAYVDVANLLMRDISSGRLLHGEKLPPERELAARLGVSVGTLRKGLGLLEAKGLVRRVHGSGNYVQASGVRETVYAMFRLERPDGGGEPGAQILSISWEHKPADLPEFGTSQEATRIRRVRLLDGVEIAVEEIWLDGSKGRLEEADLLASLYQTYLHRLGFWIMRAEDKVSLAPAPDWTPEVLGNVATMGYVERLGWTRDSAPVEFSRTWFHPARAVYVQHIT